MPGVGGLLLDEALLLTHEDDELRLELWLIFAVALAGGLAGSCACDFNLACCGCSLAVKP